MYDRLNSFVIGLEARFGSIVTPALIGLLSIIAAAIYARPDFYVSNHGHEYARMAEDPFSAPYQRVGYRILMPAISWAVGLRGDLIIVTNAIFAVVLIAVLFAYFRKQFPDRPADALIASSAITFSMVTLAPLYYGGYTDSLTYLIVFMLWQFRKRDWLFYPLLLAGLLNHESVMFLVPWFVYLKFKDTDKRRAWYVDSFLLYAAVFIAYGTWRYVLNLAAENPFTIAYYLEPMKADPLYWIKQAYPLQGLGLYTVFKGLWVIPILAVVSFWRKREFGSVKGLAILMLFVGSQMIIAIDCSRMWSLGFMVMVVALVRLFQTSEFNFRSWAVWLLIGNLFIPQFYTAAQAVRLMVSTPASLILTWMGRGVW